MKDESVIILGCVVFVVLVTLEVILFLINLRTKKRLKAVIKELKSMDGEDWKWR